MAVLYYYKSLFDEYGELHAAQSMGVHGVPTAWCEYYHEGKAYRTRCRPWESGINIEAIINYF